MSSRWHSDILGIVFSQTGWPLTLLVASLWLWLVWWGEGRVVALDTGGFLARMQSFLGSDTPFYCCFGPLYPTSGWFLFLLHAVFWRAHVKLWIPVCRLSLYPVPRLDWWELPIKASLLLLDFDSPPYLHPGPLVLQPLRAQVASDSTVWGYWDLNSPYHPMLSAYVLRILLLSSFPCIQEEKKKK